MKITQYSGKELFSLAGELGFDRNLLSVLTGMSEENLSKIENDCFEKNDDNLKVIKFLNELVHNRKTPVQQRINEAYIVLKDIRRIPDTVICQYLGISEQELECLLKDYSRETEAVVRLLDLERTLLINPF